MAKETTGRRTTAAQPAQQQTAQYPANWGGMTADQRQAWMRTNRPNRNPGERIPTPQTEPAAAPAAAAPPGEVHYQEYNQEQPEKPPEEQPREQPGRVTITLDVSSLEGVSARTFLCAFLREVLAGLEAGDAGGSPGPGLDAPADF